MFRWWVKGASAVATVTVRLLSCSLQGENMGRPFLCWLFGCAVSVVM